jgi:hypothetical protein
MRSHGGNYGGLVGITNGDAIAAGAAPTNALDDPARVACFWLRLRKRLKI